MTWQKSLYFLCAFAQRLAELFGRDYSICRSTTHHATHKRVCWPFSTESSIRLHINRIFILFSCFSHSSSFCISVVRMCLLGMQKFWLIEISTVGKLNWSLIRADFQANWSYLLQHTFLNTARLIYLYALEIHFNEKSFYSRPFFEISYFLQ